MPEVVPCYSDAAILPFRSILQRHQDLLIVDPPALLKVHPELCHGDLLQTCVIEVLRGLILAVVQLVSQAPPPCIITMTTNDSQGIKFQTTASPPCMVQSPKV